MSINGGEGFGYVQYDYKIQEDLDLSDDSRLSSTSLLKTLIEPSSSVLSFKHADDTPVTKYNSAKESARISLSYLRQTEGVVKTGMNIDYEALRKKDTERGYEKQAIPVLSDRSRKTLARKASTIPAADVFDMPLMSYLGLRDNLYQSFNRRPTGIVHSLLESIDQKSINVRRSEFLQMYKEHLDQEKEEELENRANETFYEKKLREEREAEEKRRESEVYKDYTEKEITVIKENLGTLPIRKESVFIPIGKANLIGTHEQTAEEFFAHLPSKNLSYDEYYKQKDDKEFGRLTVKQDQKKVSRRGSKNRSSTSSTSGTRPGVSSYLVNSKE